MKKLVIQDYKPQNKLESPNIFLSGILLIIFIGMLINSDFFGLKTLTAYFLYTIPACLLVFIVGLILFKNKQTLYIKNPWPLLFFIFLAVYYLLNALLTGSNSINLRHYFIMVNCLLLISYYVLFAKGLIDLFWICFIIAGLSGIEAFICILQKIGVINSMDNMFSVTGTCTNPNITAMFLAMSVPAILFIYFSFTKTVRLIIILLLIEIVTALVFLKCRTAFVGTMVAGFIILNYQYKFIDIVKRNLSTKFLIGTGLIAICFIVATVIILYYSKQTSSEGRKLIWKISLNMLANKPLTGAGYGQFEHDYNLAQAKYFMDGKGTEKEINNAAYTHMSYNEFLENLTEGGLIGLIIFSSVLLVLINKPPYKVSQTTNGIIGSSKSLISYYPFAYAGIAAFAVMSIFNFTVQALPIMGLFVFYVSICIIGYQSRNQGWKFHSKPIALAISLFSFLIFFQLQLLGKAYYQVRNLMGNKYEIDKSEKMNEMLALQPILSSSAFYWRSCGNLYYQNGNFASALEKYHQASFLSSDPDLYLMMGNCNIKALNFSAAKQMYSIARNIEPHHFAPIYALMKMYIETKDTSSALLMANEIVTRSPKIPSEKVTWFKAQAQSTLVMFKNKMTGK